MICTWRRNASTGSSCVTTRSPSNTSSPASGIRHQQMQQEPCEGRLAAAGFADYPQGLALAHRERHTVDRLDRLAAAALDREMLAQVAGDQQWLKRAAAIARIACRRVMQKRRTSYIRTSIAARSPSLTRLQQIEVMKIARPGS